MWLAGSRVLPLEVQILPYPQQHIAAFSPRILRAKQAHRPMDIDPKIAAFAYLMAETEAIASHTQTMFICGPDHPCGTSLCLAGHIAYAVEQEAVFQEPIKQFISAGTAFYMLQGCSFEEATERCTKENLSNKHLNSAYWDFQSSIVVTFDEQKALGNFKHWIETYAEPEQVKEFQDLITLDTEKLKQTVLSH